MTDNENSGLPSLSAEEQAYFDNRGNVTEPETKPETTAAETTPQETDEVEEIDVVDDDPDADVEDPDAEDQPLKKVVPLKALHKEREARKALDEKLRQLEVDRARMEERMNMMLQQMQAPQQKDDEPKQQEMPGDDDPIGQIEWLKSQFLTKQQQEQQQAKEREQQQAIQRHVMEVDTILTQAMTADPTVKEAFDFGVNAIRQHYQKQGVPPWELEQYVARDMQQYALRAPKTVEEIAEFAKANARYYGWQPVAKVTETPKPSTKSLSQASGSATGATISAQDVLRMPPDEFERWISKNPKKYRQMMGG